MIGKALELNSNYAAAYVWLAETYAAECASSWTTVPDAAERAFEFAHKAVALDDLDSNAHAMLAWAYFRLKSNFELAQTQIETALELNPNDYNSYCLKSWFLTCSGDLDGGISCGNEALRRSPIVSDGCLYIIGFAEYLAGEYTRAIATFGKMSNPGAGVQGCIAACYAQLGREDEAHAAATEFRERAKAGPIQPDKDAESWRAYWLKLFPFKELAPLNQLLDGLRKAGLPG